MLYRLQITIVGTWDVFDNIIEYVDRTLKQTLENVYHLDVDVRFDGVKFYVLINENREWLKFKLTGKRIEDELSSLDVSFASSLVDVQLIRLEWYEI